MQTNVLTEARKRIEARMQELTNELERLSQKIKILDESENIVDELNLGFQPTFELQNGASKGHRVRFNLGRRKTGLTDGILSIVLKRGRNSGLSGRDVRESLLEDGFIPTSKNFPIAVNNTLKRLANRGLIEQRESPEGKRFSAKVE